MKSPKKPSANTDMANKPAATTPSGEMLARRELVQKSPVVRSPPFEIGACLITLAAHRLLTERRVTADQLLQRHLHPQNQSQSERAGRRSEIESGQLIVSHFRLPRHIDSPHTLAGVKLVTSEERTFTFVTSFEEI